MRGDFVCVHLDVFGDVAHRASSPDEKERGRASQDFLLRVLSAFTGPEPQILRGFRGKPWLENGPEFNMSHSGGVTAVAVSGRPVGIDIELAARRPQVRPVAEKFFQPAEVDVLARCGWDALLFLRMWVRKEALCKLAGEGIYLGLRSAASGLAGASAAYRDRPAVIHEFAVNGLLVGAVATYQPADIRWDAVPPAWEIVAS